jgi:hypothetical protein
MPAADASRRRTRIADSDAQAPPRTALCLATIQLDVIGIDSRTTSRERTRRFAVPLRCTLGAHQAHAHRRQRRASAAAIGQT